MKINARLKKRGCKSVVIPSMKRVNCWKAGNSPLTSSQITAIFNAIFCARTTRSILELCEHSSQSKYSRNLSHNEDQLSEDVTFSKSYLECVHQHKQSIYTDEKCIKLDGSCNNRYFYWDKRKEKPHLLKKHMGGGNVRNGTYFSCTERGTVHIFDGTVNDKVYTAMLKEQLKKIIDKTNEGTRSSHLFMHDNA